MNEKMFELMQSPGELLARITAQREQMTETGTHWRTPLTLADQGVAAVHFLRCHPLLVVGVEAFFVIRRRGVAGLVRGCGGCGKDTAISLSFRQSCRRAAKSLWEPLKIQNFGMKRKEPRRE